MSSNVWRKIKDEYFMLKNHERLLVIADAHITLPFKCEFCIAPTTNGHGNEPSLEVWQTAFGSSAVAFLELNGLFDKILSKSLTENESRQLNEWTLKSKALVPDAVIAITHYSTSHTMFRKLLNTAGTRYASIPLFEEYLVRENGPIDIDRSKLEERCRLFHQKISGAREIHITASNGTDIRLYFEKRDFHIDDGDLKTKGKFSNLPAGEIYAAPLENKSQGILVIEDGSKLFVENGSLVKIEGKSKLKKVFSEYPEWFKVAELGIGMNDKAERIDNVLEAEKILGTIHIAFGDNSTFGGTQRIPYHVDHVIFEPELIVDGSKLGLPV